MAAGLEDKRPTNCDSQNRTGRTKGETCCRRRSIEDTRHTDLWCADTRTRDVDVRRIRRGPHGGRDNWACREGAGIRSGADGVGSRNGTTTPGRRRLRPLMRSVVAGPGAHRTNDMPRAARARLRGHEVQLVLARASAECPRPDRPRGDLHADRNLGGAARRPARRRGGQDVVSNRLGQGASGRTQPGRGRHSAGHRGRSP